MTKAFKHPQRIARLGCAAVLGVIMIACQEDRSGGLKASWNRQGQPEHRRPHVRLEQADKSLDTPHGQTVLLRGKLAYEYDDAAIYPLNDHTSFKPVWLHLDEQDADLHHFLLQHDGAVVAVIGELDTAGWFNPLEYGGALRNILEVKASQPVKTR